MFVDIMLVLFGVAIGLMASERFWKSAVDKWKKLADQLLAQQTEIMNDWRADHESKKALMERSSVMLQKYSEMFREISEAVDDHVPNCPGCARTAEVCQTRFV